MTDRRARLAREARAVDVDRRERLELDEPFGAGLGPAAEQLVEVARFDAALRSHGPLSPAMRRSIARPSRALVTESRTSTTSVPRPLPRIRPVARARTSGANTSMSTTPERDRDHVGPRCGRDREPALVNASAK
jgi:hypothetical protein